MRKDRQTDITKLIVAFAILRTHKKKWNKDIFYRGGAQNLSFPAMKAQNDTKNRKGTAGR